MSSRECIELQIIVYSSTAGHATYNYPLINAILRVLRPVRQHGQAGNAVDHRSQLTGSNIRKRSIRLGYSYVCLYSSILKTRPASLVLRVEIAITPSSLELDQHHAPC